MRFGPGKGIDHFFGDGFIDKDEVQKTNRRVDSSLPQHQTGTRHPRPLIPGDPERAAEAIRSKGGIPF
jgi:hypothetical protein